MNLIAAHLRQLAAEQKRAGHRRAARAYRHAAALIDGLHALEHG